MKAISVSQRKILRLLTQIFIVPDTKITDFGLAGSLVAEKEQVYPQENMFGTSSNEQAHVLYEEKKLSNEEP